MGAESAFLRRFDRLVESYGWVGVRSPSELVERWSWFVDLCRAGYSSTIYEYENDRSVRDLLQIVLDDPELAVLAETETHRSAVERVDAQFRSVCRDDVLIGGAEDPWWRRCVPRAVAGEFAADLASQFGIGSSG